MSGEVELSSVFGFTAPLTSGIWYQDTTMNMDYKEMLYGKVDISDMRTGSLYRFRYDVNAAVDSMCLVQGSSTVFNLKVYDLSVASGEVKICKEQFKSGMTVDLSRYVPGLSDTGRIDPKKTVWKDNTGAIISDPGNYRLIAAEGQADDTSTYKTVYRYEVRSDCGLYAGNLYVSAVDSLSSDTARNIVICYTDDYAEHVDLFQILGIAVDKNSPSGYFELYNAVNNKGAEITLATSVLDGIKQNGKINVSTLFNEANDSETYTFGYLPNTNSNSCVSNKMKITIIVTKNVKEDSQFETKI
jgi:hypothetical protein